MKRDTGAIGISTVWTFFVVSVLLPGISAVASYSGSAEISLGVFLLIGLALFAVALRKTASDGCLMLLVYCFSLSLIFSQAFLSNNLIGYDIHDEYRLFLQVSRTGHWIPTSESIYYSVLSISILPTTIAKITGLDGITVFKIVIPLLYSIIPVVLFKTYRTILPPRDAFLSVFLFVSYPAYAGNLLGLARQMIAEVFLVILIWIMLSMRLRGIISLLTIVVLTFGLIVSHYSLAFVYVGIVIFSSVLSRISHGRIETPIRAVMLVLVATVAWFFFVAGGVALVTLSRDVSIVLNTMSSDFFGGQRPAAVMLAAGAAPGSPGILHSLNRVTQWSVQFLLILGFIALALKKRKTDAENKILPPIIFAMMFLGASVVIPFLAATLELSRIYNIALLFASPCFMMGISSLERLVKGLGSMWQHSFHANLHFHMSTRHIVAAAILCLYFLFLSGWVWTMTGGMPTEIVFDSGRMLNSTDINVTRLYFNSFTTSPDIAAARWISEYQQVNRLICSDQIAQYGVLDSYGELPRGGPIPPYCGTNSYTYLREFNAIYDSFVLTPAGSVTPGSALKISGRLTAQNRVYSDIAAIYCPSSSSS